MITGNDMYTVLTAMVPLYVAMMLAYASVRWWGIFSPVQCSGINRFVAVFAVPLLSFSFISSNNPYKMDGKFILADTASKVVVFILLSCWAKFSRYGSLDWLITLFSLATLPNTLVMGIPLLQAMYGEYYGKLMVQVVVLQSIIWYTLLLFLFEYRAARLLVMEQFPETAGSIVSFKVDPDVMSLDGREPLQTQAEVGEDGKIRVLIRRSVSTSQHYELFASPRRSSAINMQDLMFASPRRSNMMGYDLYAPSPARRSNMNHAHTLDLFSMGLTTSMPSSKAITPRPSNLTGAEIYSLTTQSSTPRDITLGFTSTFNEPPFAAAAAAAAAISSGGRALPISAAGLSPRQSNFTSCEMYSLQSSRCPTPRASNFQPGANPADPSAAAGVGGDYSDPPTKNGTTANSSNAPTPPPEPNSGSTDQVHSFVWSSSTSPSVSAAVALPPAETHHSASFHHDPNAMAHDVHDYRKAENSKLGGRQYDLPSSVTPPPINVGEDFSFGSRAPQIAMGVGGGSSPHNNGNEGTSKQSVHPSTPQQQQQQGGTSSSNKCGAADQRPFGDAPLTAMPSSFVMVRLILQMVGRKLIRNPNTYASLFGIIWSLISYRYNVAMPAIVLGSLKILSQAGLGMAMFSLGLFMALQPRLIACGTSLAVFAMAIRFLVGPIVMAASSIGVGLRGVHLHAAIVQAALPQGIVPFVFAREYDLHPDILSTAVIFGMLVALPTTILYYVLLGI